MSDFRITNYNYALPLMFERIKKMDVENSEDPTNAVKLNTAEADTSSQLDRIEEYMVSIRAASWLTAIGIFSLVVYQIS
jgi:hypothetical protein